MRDWNFAVAGNNRLDGDGNYYVFLTPSDGLSSTSSSLFGTAYDDMDIGSIPAAREVDENDKFGENNQEKVDANLLKLESILSEMRELYKNRIPNDPEGYMRKL